MIQCRYVYLFQSLTQGFSEVFNCANVFLWFAFVPEARWTSRCEKILNYPNYVIPISLCNSTILSSLGSFEQPRSGSGTMENGSDRSMTPGIRSYGRFRYAPFRTLSLVNCLSVGEIEDIIYDSSFMYTVYSQGRLNKVPRPHSFQWLFQDPTHV